MHHHHQHHQKAFTDPEDFEKHHAGPDRDQWQKPHQVLAALDLNPEMTVLEIGSGTGYFGIPIAKQLSHGSYIGLETSPQMASYLEEKFQEVPLQNTQIITTTENTIPALEKNIDIILSVNVYHHIPNRAEYFRSIKKSLSKNGRIVIIDLTEEAPFGPPQQYRIPEEIVIQEMKKAGLKLVDKEELLKPIQYFLTFR